MNQQEHKKMQTMSFDYVFDAHDMTLLAKEVADLETKIRSEKMQFELYKKAQKSTIEQLEKKLQEGCALIRKGQTSREIEVEVVFNKPEYGKKTITRQDNKEVLTQNMQPHEFNLFPTFSE